MGSKIRDPALLFLPVLCLHILVSAKAQKGRLYFSPRKNVVYLDSVVFDIKLNSHFTFVTIAINNVTFCYFVHRLPALVENLLCPKLFE